jgi:hypothetical protein
MYIFAKFVADHIFLQNHDKINIKNSKILSILTKKMLDHVKSNDLEQKQINIDQASRMSVLFGMQASSYPQ